MNIFRKEDRLAQGNHETGPVRKCWLELMSVLVAGQELLKSGK